MTAGRGPRHAGRKGGAPVRKSITTRYFYSTAVLLICSIAVMGFIQMYLAMGYFREENGTALIQTIDNAILAMQEAADDGIVEKRASAASALFSKGPKPPRPPGWMWRISKGASR